MKSGKILAEMNGFGEYEVNCGTLYQMLMKETLKTRSTSQNYRANMK